MGLIFNQRGTKTFQLSYPVRTKQRSIPRNQNIQNLPSTSNPEVYKKKIFCSLETIEFWVICYLSPS